MTTHRAFRVRAKTVDGLLEGSIDTHVHFGPDSKLERSVDIDELLEMASATKMGGMVLKSKDYPTYPYAYMAKKRFPGLEPFGAVCLDHDVGGLNPDAVRTSGRLGARVVWLPTFSSASDMARFGQPEKGISCFEEEGALSRATIEVLEQIKKYDMVLATGHITVEETKAVVDKAVDIGIRRIVITHPITAHAGGQPTIDEMKRFAEQGCYIEHVLFGLMPRARVITEEELAEAIREIGPERCIMSTDAGQVFNPPPAYAMRMFIAMMLGQGISDEEVEVMVKSNPARLLGLT